MVLIVYSSHSQSLEKFKDPNSRRGRKANSYMLYSQVQLAGGHLISSLALMLFQLFVLYKIYQSRYQDSYSYNRLFPSIGFDSS